MVFLGCKFEREGVVRFFGELLYRCFCLCFLLGNIMSLDQRARVLEVVVSASCGVRDVIRRLRWKASRVVGLLEWMCDEGLVELCVVSGSGRGRPKKNIVCTRLGFEFLEAYRRLKAKPLRARKADLERAVRDALYVERLEAAGHSPFRLLLELNEVVHNISESSESSAAV